MNAIRLILIAVVITVMGIAIDTGDTMTQEDIAIALIFVGFIAFVAWMLEHGERTNV